jgi:hypothetical protein
MRSARAAIHWRCVNTESRFEALAMFPANGSLTRRLLPSTGSPRGEFPGFIGTVKRSDFLQTVSPRFVCASLGDTISRRLSSLRSGPTTAAWGQGPSGLAVPPRQLLSRWSRRVSQIPGEP